MRKVTLSFLCLITSISVAYAADCPDLTALQRWAGYLSWLGLFKVMGAGLIAVGILFVTKGIIVDLVVALQNVLEVALYLVSFALIGSGYWAGPEYLTWLVFTGCIVFMGAVFTTIFVHDIRGNDPKPLAALFTVVWGAVAAYYRMPEVAFLSTLACMQLLGFTTIVEHLSYAFGWEEKDQIPPATTAALLLLTLGTAGHIMGGQLHESIRVFYPALIWVGGLFGFLGLLIMASSYYSRNPGHYILMQILTLAFYGIGLFVGMSFAINPLAGIAGTFLAFYLAEKPLDVKPEHVVTFGLCLILSGSIIFGAWYFAQQHLPQMERYLTLTLT